MNHKKMAKWTIGLTTLTLSTYLYGQMAHSHEWDETEITTNIIEENTLTKNVNLSKREQFLASLEWDEVPSPTPSTSTISSLKYDTKSMRS